jgi:hypothetical protein
MTVRLGTSLTLTLLLLTGCNRHHAPSDRLADTASELVGAKKPAPPPLAQGPYAPRDSCGDLAGAEDFRNQLAAAVRARDADALVSLAAEDVKLDFGGGTGRAELRQRLADKDWMVWDELDQLLALGCADNQQGGITLPWFFEQHIDKVDPAAGMLVTGEKVPLQASPDPKGPVVGTISWDVVEIKTLQPDDPYQQVTASDGKQGYIATDKLRSLLDYRLLASQRNGKWSIVSLVSGD